MAVSSDQRLEVSGQWLTAGDQVSVLSSRLSECVIWRPVGPPGMAAAREGRRLSSKLLGKGLQASRRDSLTKELP